MASATSLDEATATPVDEATVTPNDIKSSIASDSVMNSNFEMSSSSLSAYSSSSSFNQYGYIGYGFTTSGAGVYRVQSFLKGFMCFQGSYAYLYDCGELDSQWGPNTESAVINFQRKYSNRLVDDGIVGPATWAIIDEWNCNHGI